MDSKESLFIYLYGWCGAVVGVLGLIGNAFSLIVLTRKEFRSSNSNLYLITLCIYDTLFLGLILMVGNLDWIVYGLDPFSLFNLQFTNPASVVIDPIAFILICCSIYTTIALSIDRCIAVVKPLMWPSICTRHRVKVILVIVFAWSVLYNIPFCLEFEFKEHFLKELNKSFVLTKGTEYSRSEFHTDVFLEYIVPVVTLVIPIIAIIVPNLIIIFVIKRQQNNMKNSCSQSNRSHHLTAQVLFISFFTLTSRVLHGVSYIALDDVVSLSQCSFSCVCVTAVSAFMVNVNAAVNFVCYCLFGRKFRTAFKQSVRSITCFGTKTNAATGKSSTRFSSSITNRTTISGTTRSKQTGFKEGENPMSDKEAKY